MVPGARHRPAAGILDRVAGAPITWGVCEVPGWGGQLDADTVLREMGQLGFVATEYGPQGFLPDRPADKAAVLAEHGLRAVGQFVPVVLHDPTHDPLPEVEATLAALGETGARTLVVAAVTGSGGYDERPALTEDAWATLLRNLDRIDDLAAAHGVAATVHPHVGTLIQSGTDVERILAGSRIALCLDTGHLLIGGGDPAGIARDHPDRVGHVHLKDVRGDLARRVRSGDVTYAAAVQEGMYVPLGRGDVDIAAIVRSLESAGYTGWYVLEQDTVLPAPAARARAVDPATRVNDVRDSLAYLRRLAEQVEAE